MGGGLHATSQGRFVSKKYLSNLIKIVTAKQVLIFSSAQLFKLRNIPNSPPKLIYWNGTYFFRQLQIECADVVSVSNVFLLPIEPLLARFDVAVIARFSIPQVELLRVLGQLAEVVQMWVACLQLQSKSAWEIGQQVKCAHSTFSSDIPWFTRSAIPFVCSALASWMATRLTTLFTGHSSVPVGGNQIVIMKKFITTTPCVI